MFTPFFASKKGRNKEPKANKTDIGAKVVFKFVDMPVKDAAFKAAYSRHVEEYAGKLPEIAMAALDKTIAHGIVRAKAGTKIQVAATRRDDRDHAALFTWPGGPADSVISLPAAKLTLFEAAPAPAAAPAPPLALAAGQTREQRFHAAVEAIDRAAPELDRLEPRIQISFTFLFI